MEKIGWHSIQATPLIFGAESVENPGRKEYFVILRRVWNLLTMFGNEKRLRLFQVLCRGRLIFEFRLLVTKLDAPSSRPVELRLSHHPSQPTQFPHAAIYDLQSLETTAPGLLEDSTLFIIRSRCSRWETSGK